MAADAKKDAKDSVDADAKAAAAKAKAASKKGKKGFSPSEQLLIMCGLMQVACSHACPTARCLRVHRS
mgnify:CR=1 FL=1